MTRTLWSILVSLLLISGVAAARERAGVRMPDSAMVAGRRLVLNGIGVREATAFKVDVYVAGLYLPQRSSDPDEILGARQPMQLRMTFVRDVDRRDVVGAFKKGFNKNVADTAPIQRRIDRFLSMIPEMHDGDTVLLTYVPGKGTTVTLNGRPRGTIPGDDFGRALFAIWLGPKPANRGLQKGLLGRS